MVEGEKINMRKDNNSHIAIFRGKEIRKAIHNKEWWFSVVDICEILTDSVDAGAYWIKLKQRLKEEGSEVVTNCHGLKLTAPDGKMNVPATGGHGGAFYFLPTPCLPASKPPIRDGSL